MRGHVPTRSRGLVEVKGLPPVEAYEVEIPDVPPPGAMSAGPEAVRTAAPGRG